MASITASEVFNEARALLNDVDSALYTDAVLLPYAKKAYREVQEIFEDNDVPVNLERSTVLDVGVGVDVIAFSGTTPLLPSDLAFPLDIYERDDGSTLESDFALMSPRRKEPMIELTDRLLYWVWREESIKFCKGGCDSIREIKIDYLAIPTQIATGATTILIGRALTFLAARTALLAAFMIGENELRAATLQQDAELAMERLVSRITKMRQDTPVRRVPFRVSGRAYGYGRGGGE